MTGKAYLVGAGPGDPDLLTVAAHRAIRRADVVLHDRLVSVGVLGLVPDEAEKIHVGKRPGGGTGQDEIHRLILDHVRRGRTVVRLKGGDPFVFGRGGEEVQALRDAGVPVEVVPGLTAGLAVPAYAGVPVTQRRVSSSVTFVTGHECDKAPGQGGVDWDAVARLGGTVVVYMGLRRVGDVVQRLVEAGRDPETPAVAVERGTLPDQRVVRASLEDLPRRVREADLGSPTLLVIGEVAALQDEIGATDPADQTSGAPAGGRSRDRVQALLASVASILPPSHG